MLKFSLAGIVICNFGWLWFACDKAVAQVTTDNTVGTQVNENGSVSEITGGEARGDNLFHSFEDFSVPGDSEAFFNNASKISNIFSRVTGANVSNINGTIRTNDASLFLVNPAGILFGAGARLDLGGGSFYGSTADSILFEGGEFSAVDSDNPPLLTVNAPIGLSFRDNPAEITNRSTVDNTGLEVASGATIGLIGGDLNLDGGLITAPGGLVELGGLSESGRVSLTDGSFSFPEGIGRSNVELTDDANVTVAGAGGGFINVNASNLRLSESSELIAGIAEDMGSADARAGDITIDATESVTIVGTDEPNVSSTNDSEFQTGIRNNIGDRAIVAERAENPEQNLTSTAIGDGGAIEIETQLLEIEQNGKVSTTGFGTGNVGDINTVSENISLGSGSIESFSRDGAVGDAGDIAIANSGEIVLNSLVADAFAGIQNQVLDAEGNAGNIEIITSSLSLEEFSIVQTDTSGAVIGNAGNITIRADESVILDGNGNFSSIVAEIQEGGVGNAGNIGVTANVLALRNGAQITARTGGQGNAGNIAITTKDSISLENNSQLVSSVTGNATGNGGNINIKTEGSLFSTNGGNLITAESQGMGNGGDITITAVDKIVAEGSERGNFSTIIFAGLSGDNANGTGGNVEINASELSLTDVATIAANSTTGSIGSAGNITINVDRLSLAENAFINAFTANDSDSGSVTVNAQRLNLASGGKILAATDSGGNAGNINLNISEQITIDNSVESSATFVNFSDESLINNLQSSPSGIYVDATENALGSGGNISVNSQNLELGNNSIISASTNSGSGGSVNLSIAENLTLSGGSLISAEAFNNADGGNVEIDSQFVIAFRDGNNDILASAEGGQGGNIRINAESLLGIEERTANDSTNDLDASSEFSLDGNVEVNVLNFDPIQGTVELPVNIVEAENTVTQTCSNNRAIASQNSFSIQGKGGVPPAPESPLSSNNISTGGDRISNIPAAIETGRGKIQPARGIRMKADGSVVLTAYHTNNAGVRITQSEIDCSS